MAGKKSDQKTNLDNTQEKKQEKKQEKNEALEKGISVKKFEDTSEWYNQVVLRSELADYSAVKGCMIIRPYGYAIWQKIMDFFNENLKALDVQNAYFPLFIPESFFKREAEHAKGFSPEVAWIANRDEDGDRLAVRPTSETVIYDSYSRWIRSWRDLPYKINQWCNVVRWETKAVRLFLRSREFLWQEGHCVYATLEEADKETWLMLEEYKRVAEELLAVPVLLGKKTENEKFAGALYTTAMEAFMPDGKALQMGTSHNLGQFFAKTFNISFLDEKGERKVPYQTSWGFSTRLIGGMVMTHGDDKGLVLPPRVAPIQVVIVPILFEDSKKAVLEEASRLFTKISKEFSVKLDDRDGYTPGWKFNEWEMKGVPLRIEIGPKDLKANEVVAVRRDTGQKSRIKIEEVQKEIRTILDMMQFDLYNKASKFLQASIEKPKTWKEFTKVIEGKKLGLIPFCGKASCEAAIKEETLASSRCIPAEQPKNPGKCLHCNDKAEYLVYFARSY